MSYNKIEIQDLNDIEYENNFEDAQNRSGWFVTVNTQKYVPEDFTNTELYHNFRIYVADYFDDIKFFIRTLDGFPTDDDRSVSVKHRIERGSKLGRLHLHFHLVVLHDSRIHFDSNLTEDYFKAVIGNGKKVHCKHHLDKQEGLSNDARLLKYMNKDIKRNR